MAERDLGELTFEEFCAAMQRELDALSPAEREQLAARWRGDAG